jgi:hypothetical protein
MEKMKPCPFCGKESGYLDEGGGGWGNVKGETKWIDEYIPRCDTDGCPASNMQWFSDDGVNVHAPSAYPTAEEAIKAWNTRPLEEKNNGN